MHYFTCKLRPYPEAEPLKKYTDGFAAVLIQFKDRWGAETLRQMYLFRQGWLIDDSWHGLHKEYPDVTYTQARDAVDPLNATALLGFWLFVLPYTGFENRARSLFMDAPLGHEPLAILLRRIQTEAVEHAW